MPTFSGIVVATSSESTGRRTLLDIVDELARPVNAADSTVRALAADAFRAAVRTMNRKGCWPWEVQEEDIAITANQRFSSTIGGAIKKPLSMHYLDAAGGTEDQPITYSPYDEFVEKYTMDVTGQAYIYTMPNLFETGQIRWFPVPSGNDNARFAYYRVTPAPRNEQEPVEIPDYATEAYMAIAWKEFVKRCPQAKQIIDIAVALSESKDAFRELSAHVRAPGDRSRTR